MKVILNIFTRKFVNTDNPKTNFTYEFDMVSLPKEDENIEIVTDDGDFYGTVIGIEFFINLVTNEERVYINVRDDSEPQN